MNRKPNKIKLRRIFNSTTPTNLIFKNKAPMISKSILIPKISEEGEIFKENNEFELNLRNYKSRIHNTSVSNSTRIKENELESKDCFNIRKSSMITEAPLLSTENKNQRNISHMKTINIASYKIMKEKEELDTKIKRLEISPLTRENNQLLNFNQNSQCQSEKKDYQDLSNQAQPYQRRYIACSQLDQRKECMNYKNFNLLACSMNSKNNHLKLKRELISKLFHARLQKLNTSEFTKPKSIVSKMQCFI